MKTALLDFISLIKCQTELVSVKLYQHGLATSSNWYLKHELNSIWVPTKHTVYSVFYTLSLIKLKTAIFQNARNLTSISGLGGGGGSWTGGKVLKANPCFTLLICSLYCVWERKTHFRPPPTLLKQHMAVFDLNNPT